MKPKIVLSLSGGMDSATLLGYYLSLNFDIVPVNFTYGSKHNDFERKCAKKLCNYYGIKDLPNIRLNFIEHLFESDLLKKGGDIPEGHYADENMKKTVVPGRNLIFASILAGYAQSINAQYIGLGVHSGDHHIYADCRSDFITSLNRTIQYSSEKQVCVLTPFIMMNKTEILKIGYGLSDEFKVPYLYTRTCYKDQEDACGVCGSCTERLEAFNNIGLPDPIKYSK